MKATLDEQAWRLIKELAGQTLNRGAWQMRLVARAERLLKARKAATWWPATKRCR